MGLGKVNIQKTKNDISKKNIVESLPQALFLHKGGKMSAENTITMAVAERRPLNFGGYTIEVHTALPGTRIDILPELVDPSDFHGDPHVDHVVRFGGAFEGLIGEDNGQYGEWDPDKLPGKNIVIMEHYYPEAQRLVGLINQLAQRFIGNPSTYDDVGACREYYDLAREGYDLLRVLEDETGFSMKGTTPVSLERAGLVSTRLALGLSKDASVRSEVRVVTKRTHLKGEPETHLTATVSWRERALLPYAIDNEPLMIADFVNPASGASVAAFVAAASTQDTVPASIHHRSIFVTSQGVHFMKNALDQMGIDTSFYSLGVCSELNDHYYLTGGKPVGDAGHALRHFLPKGYIQ